MPVYDYKCNRCGIEHIRVHSIKECDEKLQLCDECMNPMRRMISAPFIEGSSLYPFELWNIRTPDGKESMTIHDKAHHKKVLGDKGFTTPFFSVGGEIDFDVAMYLSLVVVLLIIVYFIL